jgi:hypothetical protein
VREDVQRRRARPAVERLDPDAQVLGVGLGILNEDIEVAVLVEDAGVEQFVLEPLSAAGPVLGDEAVVGEGCLRVLVQQAHVRVGRSVVEVEVVLLDVLAVVALVRSDAEQALLEDRVLLVPEGRGEAEELIAVRDAGDAVLAPAVGLAAGQLVRQVAPGVAVRGVVLADGGPGPVAEVRPPAPPAEGVVGDLAEAAVLGGVGHGRGRAMHRSIPRSRALPGNVLGRLRLPSRTACRTDTPQPGALTRGRASPGAFPGSARERGGQSMWAA